MSLRALVLLFAVACGGTTVDSDEPQTAKEKQMIEAKASGEADGGNAKWGKWRYEGDRKDCFFVLGRRCFKTENAACQAAHCKAPKKCVAVGGGPATMTCK